MSEPKITKHDILEKTSQMLQKQLYVIQTTPTNGLGPVMENIGPHLEFQVKIEQDGVMFAAGPLWADDEESWEGEGMVVIRADSLAYAGKLPSRIPCMPAAPGASPSRSAYRRWRLIFHRPRTP